VQLPLGFRMVEITFLTVDKRSSDTGAGKSHVTRHTSHVTRHTSHVSRHTSHVTRHTSHVTRHTSHVTRHTSHVTRHTSQGFLRTMRDKQARVGGRKFATLQQVIIVAFCHFCSIDYFSVRCHGLQLKCPFNLLVAAGQVLDQNCCSLPTTPTLGLRSVYSQLLFEL
jgi:hypothetical protein